MKKLANYLLISLIVLFPVALAAQVAETVTTVDIAVGVGEVVNAVQTGSWIAAAGALIMVLLNLLRLPMLGALLKKIPRRVRIALPILLGAVAGIFANMGGGMAWPEALMIGLFSGPTAVFTHEVLWKAVLGNKGE